MLLPLLLETAILLETDTDFDGGTGAAWPYCVRHPCRYAHGKPEYGMEEFELDAEEVRQRFERAELGTPRAD